MTLNRKRDYFNELAPRWDQIPSPPDTPERLSRLAARCPAGGKRVLDVGCGTGILLAHFARSGTPPEQIVELDVAEAMLLENR